MLSTSLETKSEIADHDKGDGLSALPVRQDAFTQASRPKTKSVSVTVRVKGKDKGNLGACMIPIMQFNIMHTAYAATETEKPPEQATVGIQCDLLAAPPLQKLVPHGPQPSLDDSFVTEETDTDMDTSFTCSQQDYATE